VLTIGPNGRIKAEIFAKAIVVQGEVHGNITASERADIRDNGSVDGDLSAPRIAIADGAHFRGSIDMQRAGVKPTVEHKGPEGKSSETKPSETRPSEVKASEMKASEHRAVDVKPAAPPQSLGTAPASVSQTTISPPVR